VELSDPRFQDIDEVRKRLEAQRWPRGRTTSIKDYLRVSWRCSPAINSDHDTIITNAAHDKSRLLGVTLLPVIHSAHPVASRELRVIGYCHT
jgi:hypothetical protein